MQLSVQYPVHADVRYYYHNNGISQYSSIFTTLKWWISGHLRHKLHLIRDRAGDDGIDSKYGTPVTTMPSGGCAAIGILSQRHQPVAAPADLRTDVRWRTPTAEKPSRDPADALPSLSVNPQPSRHGNRTSVRPVRNACLFGKRTLHRTQKSLEDWCDSVTVTHGRGSFLALRFYRRPWPVFTVAANEPSLWLLWHRLSKCAAR